jgi:hypothetical protein
VDDLRQKKGGVQSLSTKTQERRRTEIYIIFGWKSR